MVNGALPGQRRRKNLSSISRNCQVLQKRCGPPRCFVSANLEIDHLPPDSPTQAKNAGPGRAYELLYDYTQEYGGTFISASDEEAFTAIRILAQLDEAGEAIDRIAARAASEYRPSSR